MPVQLSEVVSLEVLPFLCLFLCFREFLLVLPVWPCVPDMSPELLPVCPELPVRPVS